MTSQAGKGTLAPLSYAQRRLWLLNQVEGAATYNVPLAIGILGHLDAAALRAAVADVVLRHESLRTVFPYEDGDAWQRILQPAEAAVPWAETACTTPQLPPAMMRAAEAGFELECELPLRAHLFTVAPGNHQLLLTLHHIACDGWSIDPLMRDLSKAYAARSSGRAPAWDPLPVQYADYAAWQRRLLGDITEPASLAARQLAYWRTVLAGLPAETGLPLDRPRPCEPTYHGAAVTARIDGDTHRRLLGLAKASRGTLFMVVQAALAEALARQGAGPDIVIGAPVAGRSSDMLDDLVGFFVNALAFRVSVTGRPTFWDLASRIREATLEAYSRQELPFDQVVKELNPPRALGRHPIFQVMLVVQEAHVAPPFPGLTTSVTPLDLDVAKFDLTLELTERSSPDGRPEGITVSAKYATDVLGRASVTELTNCLLGLLETAGAGLDS